MSKELVDKVSIHDDKNIKGMFREYRYLSNFHICDIWYEGLKYTSTEAAYQAAKLSPELREEFTKMTPAEAMKAGRERHLESDKADWLLKRIEVMNAVIFEKFKHPELRKMLLETGDKYIEETNWWGDIFWGVCEGVGENKLGHIIMNIRDYIKELENIKH